MPRVNSEVAVLRAELATLHEDIKELKEATKKLEKFMYKFEGGRAWMFGLLAIAGTMGALISQAFKLFPSSN